MHELKVHCNYGCHLLRHLGSTVLEREDEAEDVEVPAELPTATVTKEEQLALAAQDFFLITSPALFPSNDILHIRYIDPPEKWNNHFSK